MKLPRLLVFSLFPILAGLPLVGHAQTTLGTVRAFGVTGEVSLRNDTTGAVSALQTGQQFTEGYSVITGDASSVILVQSNGSTIALEENTSLSIEEFLQDPYDTTALGSYTRLEADPSTSRTRVRLNYGEASGQVSRLQPSSSYNIDLPTGSAGIRGTIWRVEVRIDWATGLFTVNIQIPEGSVSFEGDDGVIVDLTAGEEIDIGGQLAEGSTEGAIVIDTFVRSDKGQSSESVVEGIRQNIRRAIEQAREQDDSDGPTPPEPLLDEDPGDPEDPEPESRDEGPPDQRTPEGDLQDEIDEFSPAGG